jgi:capsular exopolysaccharide synthesis family protein
MIGLGIYYYSVTNPVYPITATLEFNVPTIASSTGIPAQNQLMQSLNPTNKPIIVENEIEVMQSQKLMVQLVNDLQLWANYTQKVGNAVKNLYKISPVKFQWIKQNGTLSPEGEKIKILITSRSSFILKGESGEKDQKFNFASSIKSNFGIWQLHPTANISNFVDSTIMVTISDPDLVADDYSKSIKVSLEDKDAPFVNLSMSDVVPDRGKDILNSLMKLYQNTALQNKNEESQRTLAFIDKRLDSVKKDLIVTDKDLEAYKAKEGITDVTLQAQDYFQVKDVNLAALNDNKNQLEILGTLEKYAKTSDDTKLPPVSATLLDPSLASLYDKLSELQLQREQLLATTPIDNPVYIPIDRQIERLKSDFKDKIEVIKSSLTASKAVLEKNRAGLQSTLQKSPEQARQFNALSRDQVTKEKLYTDLLALREEISLRYASAISDSQIVDDAHAGLVKWPKLSVVFGLALILGLVFPTGVIYTRETLNDRIITRRQIEDEAGVPIIAELSYLDSKEPIVVTEGRSKFLIGEQFRTLRTNLFHLHGHHGKGRVTLFTSSIGGEGKSFISSNLAVTLAYASRKVILLEMDLRKPKVSVNFGISPEHTGISNFLADDSTKLAGLAQPSGIPGLDILTCGPILPNPSELLEKSRLDEMINSLKEIYDDIIIDSPPIHLVTDAIVISRVTDASLYVVRQGYTYKNELEFIGEIYSSNRLPKFNVIFNGVKSDKHGYGYNYSSKSYGSYNNAKEKLSIGKIMRKVLSRF